MIHMIAAVARDGGIGRNNQLLCRISADLKRFKSLTMGHAMIMGRKTFESLPGILPGRTHIILTHQQDYAVGRKDLVVCRSVDEICRLLQKENEYFVIGGASVYEAFMDKADSLYITEIDAVFQADTYFPPIDKKRWLEAERESYAADGKSFGFSFVHYVKKPEKLCRQVM